jgi:hypothetical protein
MRLSKSQARMRIERSARSAARANASKYSWPSTIMVARPACAAAQQFSPRRNREEVIASFSAGKAKPLG